MLMWRCRANQELGGIQYATISPMMPHNVDGNTLLAGGKLGQIKRGITFSYLGFFLKLNTSNCKENQIACTPTQI